jgi:TRAP-type transport system periplasmic protein
VDHSHYGRGGAALAAAVAANPIGTIIRIEAHGNAELGMLKSCANGTLDLVVYSNSVVGNLVPENGWLNAPFVFAGLAHARAVLDGPVGKEFAELATAKKINLIAWGENGLRHITANRAIRTPPSDLKGLKIRVPQSEVMLGGMRALGADAAPLNFNLLRKALRTGQFEAEENPIVVIEAAEVCGKRASRMLHAPITITRETVTASSHRSGWFGA